MSKTKVFVHGERVENVERSGKPIEFVKRVCEGMTINKSGIKPYDWENVDLLPVKCYTFDFIKVWDDNEECGSVYLGHWNGGWVEYLGE